MTAKQARCWWTPNKISAFVVPKRSSRRRELRIAARPTDTKPMRWHSARAASRPHATAFDLCVSLAGKSVGGDLTCCGHQPISQIIMPSSASGGHRSNRSWSISGVKWIEYLGFLFAGRIGSRSRASPL